MDQVYDIGSTVRAKFLPQSVSRVMGEVVQGDEFILQIRCWICGLTFQNNMDMLNHLHPEHTFDRNEEFPWEVDTYLKPFMSEDAFLHSFGGDEYDQDECTPLVHRAELLREVDNVKDFVGIFLEDENVLYVVLYELDYVHGTFKKVHVYVHEFPIAGNKDQNVIAGNGMSGGELGRFPAWEWKDKSLKVSFANVVAREFKIVNENHFGAYSSFGIHREMINDKVRTNFYRAAILNNPSLMSHATTLDVVCGTGILSLFAAQAGTVLPDFVTRFAAGIGRGGTSVQTFDLVTWESSNVDFTSSFELEPKIDGSGECYGIVLWFETAFTSRLCNEMPVVLSTSPFKSTPHWSHTILTFREPTAISSARLVADKVGIDSRGNPLVLGI
ncbi:probable protein arginine N-methyltransferase 3 [Aristolochia californica]|uniref:probable protein arginine N-methyltransferase 3 n=1 Tax=Aristolochia californica TaxID=171875 RepID=UPI0035E3AE65